jgi:hypothetical protein
VAQPDSTPTTAQSVSARVSRSNQLAQSCVVLAIAIAIVVMAFSCFGLWALADYVAIEVLGWDYRPIPELILPLLPFLLH